MRIFVRIKKGNMKIYGLITFGLLLVASCGMMDKKPNEEKQTSANNAETMPQSIHQFKVTDIEGNTFDFSSLKGKSWL